MDDDGETPFDVAVGARNVWGCKMLIDFVSGRRGVGENWYRFSGKQIIFYIF